jgi:hypothetical protein
MLQRRLLYSTDVPMRHLLSAIFADPFEQTGAGAASAMRGTTWKGAQRPAVAFSSGNAGTTVSRNYLSGAGPSS